MDATSSTFTDGREDECLCPECTTNKTHKLNGKTFCSTGVSKKAKKVKLHLGCWCANCTIRHDMTDGMLFCLLKDGKHYPLAFEEPREDSEKVVYASLKDVKLTLGPAGSKTEAIEIEMER